MISAAIYEKTLRHFLSPLRELLDDEEVTEIMVNGHQTVYFEKAGCLYLAPTSFPDEGSLIAAVRNISEFVNRRIDSHNHSMDARLPDGSRVHAMIAPCSRIGTCLTIRKFQKSSFCLDRLIEKGSLSRLAADFLRVCVQLHKNIVVAGGTGTGKTSMLNALSSAIPDDERIVVIEDSSELQLNQRHAIYLESQPPGFHGEPEVTVRQLFVDSLRMRPDRVIVGEVRRGEALDMIQSMLSGHAGSLSTVHASSPQDAAARLEILSMMSDVGLPSHVARTQVASAVHLVVQLRRYKDGSRGVHAISELVGQDDRGDYLWRVLFRSQFVNPKDQVASSRLQPTGQVPSFANEPYEVGVTSDSLERCSLFEPAPASSIDTEFLSGNKSFAQSE